MKCFKNTWLAFLLGMHFTKGHWQYSVFFANHSGKRTCATFSYQADIQEQSIISRTGHQSLESVRKYRRPFSEMLKYVSIAIENSVPISKKINLEAVDASMNVPNEKPVSNSTFNNCTFICNLMKWDRFGWRVCDCTCLETMASCHSQTEKRWRSTELYSL